MLLVHAHPVEESYNRALRDRIVAALETRHEVDVLDLYAEGFDPVTSRAERLGYHDVPANIDPVRPYVDRVMLPGVSFHIEPDGNARGGLTHLQKPGAVVTYGQTRWRAFLMGGYPRKIVQRYRLRLNQPCDIGQ